MTASQTPLVFVKLYDSRYGVYVNPSEVVTIEEGAGAACTMRLRDGTRRLCAGSAQEVMAQLWPTDGAR